MDSVLAMLIMKMPTPLPLPLLRSRLQWHFSGRSSARRYPPAPCGHLAACTLACSDDAATDGGDRDVAADIDVALRRRARVESIPFDMATLFFIWLGFWARRGCRSLSLALYRSLATLHCTVS